MTASIITALWKDVQEKAYRLLSTNCIDIDAISTYSILCTVHGDTDTYQTYVNNEARVTKNNSITKANWFCTCMWGNYSNTGKRPHDGADSYSSVKSNNRFCSHAYAAFLMLQQYRKLSKENNKQDVEDQNVDNQNLQEDQTVDQTQQDQDDVNNPTSYLGNATDNDIDTSYINDLNNQALDEATDQSSDNDFDIDDQNVDDEDNDESSQ